MGKDLALKKPKLEPLPVNEEEEEEEEETGAICNGRGGADMGRREQEEALLALIEHRTKEVDHLRRRVSYYCSQLNEAESRLRDSESKLARIRGEANGLSSKSFLKNGVKNIKVEHETTSHVHVNEGSSHNQLISKPVLLIPAAKPKVFQPIKLVDCGMEALNCSSDEDDVSVSAIYNDVGKFIEKKSPSVSSEREATENRDKGTKRKLEQKEEKELIPLVRNSTSPSMIQYTSSHISSQHKRKLRSLAVCPVDDQLFVTSALDGVVNLWQIEARGSGACLLSANDCLSQKQRRWPEDIAWHPKGNSLVSVYSADGGDSQISVLSLNKTCDGPRVTFLEDKPHSKGIINSIIFTPWADACFVTGGSDHAVICWSETDGEKLWKPNALHRNLHSSAVMGVAGMQQNHFVMSAGADKRIFGFDVVAGRPSFKHQIESKCMSILPNPCDFNLFMVQTGTPERQLRLFDIRCRQEEIHEFGWKQESSGSQSALINQAWSPDGLYLTSGSADPVIHIFDIRFNAHKPSQSIKAHQKRVFKAVWHCSLPLLISISSDLNIGLHKIT